MVPASAPIPLRVLTQAVKESLSTQIGTKCYQPTRPTSQRLWRPAKPARLSTSSDLSRIGTTHPRRPLRRVTWARLSNAPDHTSMYDTIARACFVRTRSPMRLSYANAITVLCRALRPATRTLKNVASLAIIQVPLATASLCQPLVGVDPQSAISACSAILSCLRSIPAPNLSSIVKAHLLSQVPAIVKARLSSRSSQLYKMTIWHSHTTVNRQWPQTRTTSPLLEKPKRARSTSHPQNRLAIRAFKQWWPDHLTWSHV